MKKNFGLGLLALTMSLASCSGDDSSDSTNNNNNNNGSQGTITATVNGEEWTGTVTSATLLQVESMGQQRLDITAEGDGQRIIVTCSSAYGATMPLTTYIFEDDASGDALFMNYYLQGNNSFMVHMPNTGEVTLTSFNDGTKKVSGNFEFTATKEGEIEGIDVPEMYTVTDGEFNNVKYTVYAQ